MAQSRVGALTSGCYDLAAGAGARPSRQGRVAPDVPRHPPSFRTPSTWLREVEWFHIRHWAGDPNGAGADDGRDAGPVAVPARMAGPGAVPPPALARPAPLWVVPITGVGLQRLALPPRMGPPLAAVWQGRVREI